MKASAGSGKTYRLSREYIDLLLAGDPQRYKHILAVTFTNKATDEMKTRILKELHLLSTDPASSPYFKDFVPSGFALLAVNGLTQLLAAVMLIKKHRLANWAVLACGIILMLWIVLEWWVWGFNPISNLYFVFGLLELAAAVYCFRRK